MADIPASNWDETDANNDDAAPDGAPEGMAPSGVNNVLRAIMGAIKRWFKWNAPITTAGTSAAYTATYTVAPGALVDGMSHVIQFNAANADSATLNVNSLGATPLHILKPAGWGVIPANTVINGMVCRVVYNSSAGAYRIVSGPKTAVVSGSDVYTVGPDSTRTQMSVGVAINTSTTAVNFPVAFSAAPYTVQVTLNSATGTTDVNQVFVSTSSATGFSIVNAYSNNINFSYLAIGPA